MPETTIPPAVRRDVQILWDYHDPRHDLRPCEVGVGLGGLDLGVPAVVVDLFHRGMFPLVVFTGGNPPATAHRFPRGEAVHYAEYALAHGVPPAAILLETRATNTLENLAFTRAALAAHRLRPRSVLIVSRPYQRRRAYATCRKVWPEVEVLCAARPVPLDDYVADVGDARRVIDMVVGDTQRIDLYARLGYAVAQAIPAEVRRAYDRLVAAGYTGRLA
ncbi:YdcF family protein [Planosporangium sp. 12N6]|uniref:YdcF family protein n=1 Tax=Planosporangium spinosum TaxID=3402278 RepID=UPI003CF56372